VKQNPQASIGVQIGHNARNRRSRSAEYALINLIRLEAQQDVFNYVPMFYNSYRLHSYLGYVSPNQYEAEMKKAA